MRRWSPLIPALVAAGAVWLTGCGEPDPSPSPLLVALRADPMASYVPPGARLTGTREQDQGSSLGKKFVVRYRRNFSVPADRERAALSEARRAAADAGWRPLGPPSRTRTEFGSTDASSARRTVPGDRDGDREASLVILLITPPGATSSTPRELQIDLSSGNQVADRK